MKIVIKNAKVIDSGSKWHHQTVDFLILDGLITKIEKNINEENATIITSEKLCV